MSFGLSISDFITVATVCWKVYKECKESIGEFKNISAEVGGLYTVLKEVEELLSEQKLNSKGESRLVVLITDCHDVIKDVEKRLNKYKSLGTKSSRTWDRLRWGINDINDLRLRLISQTTLLDAFNNT